MLELENIYNKLRSESHSNAFDCFGYGYIFEQRAKRLRRNLTLLQVLGVIVPATVGSILIGYGTKFKYLEAIISIAIFTSVIQFIISIWALIYKWDDELSYAYDAMQSYQSLYNRFSNLGKFPPPSYELLRVDYDLINADYITRNQLNTQHNIKEWEKRLGMHYSLREHKELCYGCQIKPLSMNSTNCYVCGNYSLKYQLYKS